MAKKKSEESKRIQITYLPISSIELFEENPNVQDDKTFTMLMDSIREDGMFDPIDVVPAEDGKYKVIGGEHRYRACTLLGHEEIPTIIHSNYEDDKQKAMLVKLNVMRGKIDANKFVELYQKLSSKYSEDVLKKMMGFADEQAFKNMVKSVQNSLPEEIKEKAKEKMKDVKNVDDLALLLNSLFRKHGDTLDRSYMVFDFGGKSHLWVQMDKELKDIMDGIMEESVEKSENINAIIKRRFAQYF